ncbi:MAG: nucleoside kinase [Paludibacteraceae bacterium]|nr:nucleoside kinase [Paludibacteraceae bacterium]
MTKPYITFNYPDETARLRHTVAYINEQIESGHGAQLVANGEAWHDEQLKRIATDICARPEIRIVLLAGPSSSGKTSTSHRLCLQLLDCGRQPVALSLDNWFVESGRTPLDENGKPDYESVYALDLELLNNDLQGLITGKQVDLPTFNFLTSKREYNGEQLQLKQTNILVIEGIHALNPLLTEHIPAEGKYKVFAAPMSPISLDGERWIPTSVNRLLRRISRDLRTRGHSPLDTIALWPSVRAGETKWIEPFRQEANAQFDTSMVYELPAIKVNVERALQTVPATAPEYEMAKQLQFFLKFFEPLETDLVPRTSLLREFIGGSQFNVG